ncbi:rab5 GDP/GTP exchange factor-like isoform X2 [Xenopus laevis]|uniref:Rab5 GDP/GTP exchange factor-like isoform X2 n=1 Tax=Xenopus laevis TaxID=8355 RepID=A0A8J0V4Y5_XENLA|nr:rab5 GDP/GTP exchange factor-like isoform X2 [Xenopus laevis]
MNVAPPKQEPHLPHWGKSPTFLHPQEADLYKRGFVYQPEMCRENCGYYGNPAWHGYCSRCWIKERQKRLTSPLTDGFRHHTGTLFLRSERENTSELRQNANTVRVVAINTDTTYVQHSQSTYRHFPTTDVTDPRFFIPWSSLESMAKGDFSCFLKALRSQDAQQLNTQCTNLIQRLQDAENLKPNKMGEQVQDFYHKIADHFPDHMPEERDHFLDNIEKLVMTRLYRSVFCLDGSPDEQKDLSLQRRIKSLNWVTPKMLQVPLDENIIEVKDWILSAVTAMVEMDSKRAPQDKLTCVSRASNCLFKSIGASKKDPATTDDFLSCLIYITLRANPPRLVSNLEYITRFCNPVRLTTGEWGYCFTNLCCAVSFIETLDASSLSLTQEEFDCLMKQHKTELSTPNLAAQQSTLQQMQHNKKLLAELQCRQDSLIQRAEILEKELRAWPQLIQGEVKAIIHRFPLDPSRTPSQS